MRVNSHFLSWKSGDEAMVGGATTSPRRSPLYDYRLSRYLTTTAAYTFSSLGRQLHKTAASRYPASLGEASLSS